jgi:mono/diheme cytochrome c family protein
MKTYILAVAVLLAQWGQILFLAHLSSDERTNVQETRSDPTFTGTIAPIVYANCVTCHRPGQAAPFSLISYEDVAKRAKLITKVTRSRYMPPWHAAHGYGEFADERRLTDEQIAVIGEWVKRGMPRGDMRSTPKVPEFPDGWQLGKPDLILEMPAGFQVPADGPDIYRNFVLPTGLAEDKWVRAVEFHPSARKAVHHAIFSFVRGGAVKAVAADGQPGFRGGMPVAFIPGFAPAGELGSWAVGGTPRFLPEGLARSIGKGSDFILQVHFHPTGKPEVEKSTVGIYFADTAPARRLRTPAIPGFFGFMAGIDIPPGEKNYKIAGTMTTGADMKLYSVTAHAHYLGKEIKATATLPDGTIQPLLWIQDWDFNWQDRYDYKQPVLLPQGTRIDATITYDNSADNPRNPCSPPRRVRWGVQSLDEMGTVSFLMVAVNAEDEAKLQQQGGAMLKAAIAQVANSEKFKEYLAQQKRFMAEADGEAAVGCAPAGK